MVASRREASFPWERMADLDERLGVAFCEFNGDEKRGVQCKGCLVQVWEPRTSSSGLVVLETKDLPVLISGVGDVLALFRCVCCSHHLYPDHGGSELMSAVGRVFVTGEVVHACSMRKPQLLDTPDLDSTNKGLHNLMYLPLFSDATRSSLVGVLEFVCLDNNKVAASAVVSLVECLENAHLHSIGSETLAGLQLDAPLMPKMVA